MAIKKKMQILSANVGVQIKPVFQTRKIGQILALKEKKPPIVNNQCVVYKLNLNVICATQIMSGTPPDIYTSALTNTNTRQSGGILSNMAYWRPIWLTGNFLS